MHCRGLIRNTQTMSATDLIEIARKIHKDAVALFAFDPTGETQTITELPTIKRTDDTLLLVFPSQNLDAEERSEYIDENFPATRVSLSLDQAEALRARLQMIIHPN